MIFKVLLFFKNTKYVDMILHTTIDGEGKPAPFFYCATVPFSGSGSVQRIIEVAPQNLVCRLPSKKIQ